MATEELCEVLSGKGWPMPQGRGFDWAPPGPTKPACLRKNTCYIVVALIFNEKNEVLMMQEAKRECYGAWYLPAGRMEPKETIVQAMQREVKEETGLECQPLTLLAVEERGATWLRFVFLAQPTGGALKTPQDADAESLQACWWDRESPALSLRARDILPLMELALQYRAHPRHPATLPSELPCACICQRLLVVFTGSSDALWVLLGTAGSLHLPLAASSVTPSEPGHGLLAYVHQLLQECLGPFHGAARVLGLLGLQHVGKEPGQSDGICFHTVVMIEDTGQETPPELHSQAFTWGKVEDAALHSKLLRRLSESAFIPIRS